MPVGPIDPSAVSLAQPHKPYDGVSSLDGASGIGGLSNESQPKDVDGFASLFADAVGRANASDSVAHTAALDLAAGRTDDIHGTMIEAQKANIEMKLLGNVRNKVVDAFYELWRMSV
jgi:flagellar hook-basal body complex protein FliE